MLLLVLFLCSGALGQVFHYQPEQIHIAYGDNVYEIIVTWSTFNDTEESLVEYGIGGLTLTATGTRRLFIDGGNEKHAQYIHKVKLSELTPNTNYRK